MSDQENPSSADGGMMTEDAAAALILGGLDDEDRDNDTDTADGEASAEAQSGDEATAEAEGAETDEATESREDEGEEADYYDFDKIHPDTQIRLRDGTVKRFGDVKKDWAELQELPRQRQEFETQRASLNQQAAQTARQAQFYQQVLPLVEQFMQANTPKPPEMPADDPSDPIGNIERWNSYNRQVAEFQGKMGQMQQLARAREQFQAQQHQQTEAQRQEQLKLNQQKLYEVMPTLRDEAKRNEFVREMNKFGQEVYGFSAEDMNGIGDYRLIPLIKDAIAYRKLQASKPRAAEKAKDAGPVQKPGKRASESEQQAGAYREKMTRLQKTGSADDAAALILAHHLL